MTTSSGVVLQRRIDEFTRCLRIKLAGWSQSEQGRAYPYARHIAVVPDLFSLLLGLALEAELRPSQRGLLLAAIVYVVNPGDFLPEGIVGPEGYADDAAVVALALDEVLDTVSAPEVAEHWHGPAAPQTVVREILIDAPEMLGPVLWQKVQSWVHLGE
jgi:uncharacterized membrane protein YkvA (DUF1232 family)